MERPYWHDRGYCATVCGRVSTSADVLTGPEGHPLLRLVTEGRPGHLACAPGFLSPCDPAEMVGLLNFAKAQGAATGFFQFRGEDDSDVKIWLEDHAPYFLIEERSCVHIPLLADEEAMIAACRRDTRSRLRAALREGVRYEFRLHENFSDFYDRIAGHNGFSAAYCYSADEIEKMCRADGAWPVSVFDDTGAYLGGSLLGRVSAQMCDYIISAYDSDNLNTGRAVLWASLRAALDLGFSAVNLGGGVLEEDGLYDFKMSFGGVPAAFYTIKIVFDSDAYQAGYGEKAGAPPFDLTGRFPPS